MDGSDRYLGNQPRIQVLDLFFRPDQGVDFVTGPNVLVAAFSWDYGLQWQLIFDCDLHRVRPVQHACPMGKPLRIVGRIQNESAELGDGFRLSGQEIVLEPVHARIEVLYGAERRGSGPIVCALKLGQLSAAFGIRHRMSVLFGFKSFSRCCSLAFVSRGASEQLSQSDSGAPERTVPSVAVVVVGLTHQPRTVGSSVPV